jgi:hypothetical protein
MTVRMRNMRHPRSRAHPSSGCDWRPHQGPGAPKARIPSRGWQTGPQLRVRMVPRTF